MPSDDRNNSENRETSEGLTARYFTGVLTKGLDGEWEMFDGTAWIAVSIDERESAHLLGVRHSWILTQEKRGAHGQSPVRWWGFEGDPRCVQPVMAGWSWSVSRGWSSRAIEVSER